MRTIVESWISFSPFSKRESVGVLTPAISAKRACVNRCCLRLCLASSTSAGQLMQNCRSIVSPFFLSAVFGVYSCPCLPFQAPPGHAGVAFRETRLLLALLREKYRSPFPFEADVSHPTYRASYCEHRKHLKQS